MKKAKLICINKSVNIDCTFIGKKATKNNFSKCNSPENQIKKCRVACE